MDDAKLRNAKLGNAKLEEGKNTNPRQCASAQGVLPPPLLKGRAGVGFISSSFPRRAKEQASNLYTLYHLHQFFKKPIPGFCAQHSHP